MKLRPKDTISQSILETYRQMGLLEYPVTASNSTNLLEQIQIKREPIIQGLTDFRKSQQQDQNWRKNRWGYMKGIKKWHRSLDGKRFHRAMGRHLASRIAKDKANPLLDRETSLQRSESINPALIAVSSMRTHLYLEKEYYTPLLEDAVEIYSLIDYAIPHLQRIEEKLFANPTATLTADEHELLLRLVDRKELWKSFSEVYNVPLSFVESTIKATWKSLRHSLPYTSSYFMTEVTNLLAERLGKHGNS